MIAQGYGQILAVSPDGTRLVTDRDAGAQPFAAGPRSQEVVVWDLTTGRELFQLRGGFAGGPAAPLQATFSPDGRRIATCSATRVGTTYSAGHSLPKDAEVKLWDAATGDELGCLARDVDATLLSFSPDGHRLIACGPSSIRVWDATPLPEKQ
jgi:WD40 repeat protein